MPRERKALFVFLLLASVVYFYPYYANHRFIVAAAHTDDDLYAYSSVTRNPENFRNDVFHYLVPCFVKGTLLNWGTLWLVNEVGVPIAFLSLSLQAFMFFMLPLCYVYLLKDHLGELWLALLFLVGLLASHYSWNLSNHGMVELPYRPHIAIPLLFIGILLVLADRKSGYVVMAGGILFHVPMGVYAFATIVIWQWVHYRRFFTPSTVWLIPLVLSIVVPSYLVLSQDIPVVPKQDLIDLYRFNMHFLPWDSPFRWQESVSTVSALVLFAWVSFPYRNRPGTAYGDLVVASLLATSLLSASHLVGLFLDIPSLISICGLRSLAFFSVVLVPVVFLFLEETIRNGDIFEKSTGAFLLITMIIGRPYGLFVFPVLLLLLYVPLKSSMPDRSGELPRGFVAGMALLWLCGWAVFSMPPGAVLAGWVTRMTGSYSQYLNGFVLPLLTDAAPSVSRMPLLVAGLGWLMLVVAMLIRTFQWMPRATVPSLLAIIACGFLVASSYQTLYQTGSRQARDLYDVQVWAREHTARSDMFIVYGGSWRAFSERPAFVPRNFGYYMYLPDMRIKAYDDFVFKFYGIEQPYRYESQASLMRAVEKGYQNMQEKDFYRMALAVNAKYLVETRRFKLPIVYMNSTYAVYLLL